MFESKSSECRIKAAKQITKRLVDHAVDLLWINESNAVTLYSDVLAKQIPRSYAAHAFNVFRRTMYQIEIVRLCALWDKPTTNLQRETVPTAIELIDDPAVLLELSESARRQYPPIAEEARQDDADIEVLNFYRKKIGAEYAQRALNELQAAIEKARLLQQSTRLTAIRALRNHHVAHNLSTEAKTKIGEIEPIKSHDEGIILDETLSIIKPLYGWVNGVGFSFEASRQIDRKCVEELWHKCTFAIPPER